MKKIQVTSQLPSLLSGVLLPVLGTFRIEILMQRPQILPGTLSEFLQSFQENSEIIPKI